jgi:hypothetical protein
MDLELPPEIITVPTSSMPVGFLETAYFDDCAKATEQGRALPNILNYVKYSRRGAVY